MLRQPGPTEKWQNDPAKIARAVKSLSIAAVMLLWTTTDLLSIGCIIKILSYISENVAATLLQTDGSVVSRTIELHICLSMTRCTHRILGDFNPGVQPRGTPITAEVVHGGDVSINVIWRDVQGRAVTSSWFKSLGGYLPNSNSDDGRAPLDGRD